MFELAHSIVNVTAFPPSGPGALAGWEAECRCGDRYRTSLSAREAMKLGVGHAEYMNRKLAAA